MVSESKRFKKDVSSKLVFNCNKLSLKTINSKC